MSSNLRISVLIFALLLIITVVLILRKGKLSTKYAIMWLFVAFIMSILIIFPHILIFLTKLLGFEVQSNMIFSIFIGLIIYISISLTIIVSKQKEKINSLIREVSILKEKINKK